MRWLVLLLVVNISWGQGNFMKLVVPTKEDETIPSGIIINQTLFFALTPVDSIVYPSKRSSYLIKVDDSLNVLNKIKVTPDTFRQAVIQRLFELIHPI